MRTIEDITEFEQTPFQERFKTLCTYDYLAEICGQDTDRQLLSFVRNGEKAAESSSWTRRQMLEEVTKRANLYTSLGATPEQGVAIILGNLPEAYFATFGAQQAAYSVAINPAMSSDHMANILLDSNAHIVVGPDKTVDAEAHRRVVEAARLANISTVLSAGFPQADVSNATDLGRKLESMPGDRLLASRSFSGTEIAACFHTGGTTGAPKVAMLTHENLLYEAWIVSELLEMTDQDTAMIGLPLYHVHGMVPASLSFLGVGAHLIIAGLNGYRSLDIRNNWWKLVDEYRVTAFNAVPTIFQDLLGVPFGNSSVSSLRLAVSGSAPMSVALKERFEESTGLQILEGYGLTEGTCVSTLELPNAPRKQGSVGLRLPYQDLIIAEVSHGSSKRIARYCDAGESGSLLVRGNNVFAGYVNSEQTKNTFVDGWLDTGDIARLDEDGYVWLEGRTKDLIKRSGQSIDPRTVEDTLLSHPAVALAAVVGRSDHRAGEVPVAYVELNPGQSMDSATLRDYVRKRSVEPHTVPASVEIVDELPRTAVGKIFKPALRNRVLADQILEAANNHGLKVKDVLIGESYKGDKPIEVVLHSSEGRVGEEFVTFISELLGVQITLNVEVQEI